MMLANYRRSPTRDLGPGNGRLRRGVTLVEMLVTVAVLVIIMTILVQIFQAATGAVSAAQAYQSLDDKLRRIDGIIRADLEGATARFTPPLDPAQNLGYFEYGENEFADNQGEDCDDYIRFTTKAPEGRPFTGRMWVNPWFNTNTNQTFGANPNSPNFGSFPVTVTSDYAEIIYFLRNGNLYRRVLLVAPQLQSGIAPAVANLAVLPLSVPNGGTIYPFQPTVLGGPNVNGPSVSWQGVNDLSAHPAPSGPNINTAQSAFSQAQTTIVLNTLGHLTNRENRPFYARWGNDFFDANTSTNQPDGIPDDINNDNYPDLYQGLYPNAFNIGLVNAPAGAAGFASGAQQIVQTLTQGVGLLAFPYVFPGAYSRAQAFQNQTYQYGWIHAPAPFANASGQMVSFDQGGLNYLNGLNHNPLDLGDNLPTPANPTLQNGSEQQLLQTWWGFPTWRETMSPWWTDPTVQVNVGPGPVNNPSPQQPVGLNYQLLNIMGGTVNIANPNNVLQNLLPPMVSNWVAGGNTVSIPWLHNTDQLFCDQMGTSPTSIFLTNLNNGNLNLPLWAQTWEDDLIMTGVRSFDIKAFEPVLGSYADLGWGDDMRMYLPYQNAAGGGPYGFLLTNSTIAGSTYSPSNFNPQNVLPTSLFLAGTPPLMVWPPVNPASNPSAVLYNTFGQSLAHEGRMPPLPTDNVFDAQFGVATNYLGPLSPYLLANGGTYNNGNVGDPSNQIVRLRRVWDTWSTDYSRAPGSGIGTLNGGFPTGPVVGGTPPLYPSYPPPYPAPLRGIQIQIRVVDPTNQRIKSLTIRQDFSDKL
jgi:prepilin-type N-terminal cleavage/methylation domain-containing protein